MPNQLIVVYRGGARTVINTTYIGARMIVRTARMNLFPVVESATYNGLEVVL